MTTQAPLTPVSEARFANVEHLYHAQVAIVEVVEFGTALQSVLSGEVPPPACGARFDVHVEGTLSGPKLNGKFTAVDYVSIRADGRLELHIHGVLTTDDGARIAAFIDGVGTVDSAAGKVHLHENVSLHSSDPRYQWVNALPVWARGAVDLQAMQVQADGYVV